MRKALVSLLLTLVCLGSAVAQTKLEWQLKKGETFVAERIYTQKQTVTVRGKTQSAERRKFLVSSITVKDKTASGFLLDIVFEEAELGATGEKVASGARRDDFGQKLADQLKGNGFSVVVTGQGKVAKILGYDAFLRKLGDGSVSTEKSLRTLLSEDVLRDDLEEVFHPLPEKAIRVGDSWKRETIEPLPPFGLVHTTAEYSLKSDKADEVEIGLKFKVSYKPAPGDGELFRVVKGSAAAEMATGVIRFDAKRGRLTRAEKTLTIRGEIVIESMGKQTPMEFTSENNVQVRVYDKMDNVGNAKN